MFPNERRCQYDVSTHHLEHPLVIMVIMVILTPWNEDVATHTPTQTIPNHHYGSPFSQVLALFIPPLLPLAPRLPHS